MAHRDFSASLDEALANRPTFTLQGIDFMCKPSLPWRSMAKAITAIDAASEAPEELEKAIVGFFDIVLIKAARPKMRALLEAEDEDEDDALPVSMQQLTDVVRWVVEQYTGSPTQPSSDSSASPNGTGEGSKAATSSMEDVASLV